MPQHLWCRLLALTGLSQAGVALSDVSFALRVLWRLPLSAPLPGQAEAVATVLETSGVFEGLDGAQAALLASHVEYLECGPDAVTPPSLFSPLSCIPLSLLLCA